MSEWFQKNSLSLIIAVIGVVSTYAVYGFRLTALEADLDEAMSVIQELQAGDTSTQVALAKIQVDIEYIKIQLTKLVH